MQVCQNMHDFLFHKGQKFPSKMMKSKIFNVSFSKPCSYITWADFHHSDNNSFLLSILNEVYACSIRCNHLYEGLNIYAVPTSIFLFIVFRLSTDDGTDFLKAVTFLSRILFSAKQIVLCFRGRYDHVSETTIPLFYLVSWATGLISDAILVVLKLK